MKKLIATLAIVALATPAFAVITGSKHDFRGGNATEEICVYCHTPHGAQPGTAATYQPLWNRTNGATTLTSVYTSTTLNVTEGADVSAIDAPLCFSCHAGGAINAGLLNPPNVNGATNNQNVAGTNLEITAAMNNDHPINFAPVDDGGLNFAVIGAAPYLLNGGVFQCSTCHDVHNGGTGESLLHVTNQASGLCLDCHAK